MMLPMIGLVAFGNEAPADRFTYLPQIGIAVALAWWAAACCWRKPYRRWLYGAASVLAVLVLMGLAFDQVSYWRNSETLWRRTLACTSDNYWVHKLLGSALGDAKRDDEAESEFRAEIKIIGKALATARRTNEGKPPSLEVIGLKRDCADAYYRLGVTEFHRNRIDLALRYYQRAVNADARNALAQSNLGYTLLLSGEYDEALDHLKEAVKIAPEFASAHYNYGLALHALRHLDPAIAEYNAALKIRPDYAEAYYDLGIIHVARGQRDDAAACYRAALKIKPDFPEVQRSLKALKAGRGP